MKECVFQLLDYERLRIYFEHEQSFISRNCKKVFFSSTLNVIYVNFFFEFLNFCYQLEGTVDNFPWCNIKDRNVTFVLPN